MNRDIPCQAIVDPEGEGWMVTVTGFHIATPDEPQTRIYTIDQKTDNEAAQEGLRIFTEELEARAGE